MKKLRTSADRNLLVRRSLREGSQTETRNPQPDKKGQAILALVFVIGGIVVLIGLTIAFLAISFVNSSYGYRAAQRAEAVASSGANDALIQLARNASSSSSGYTLTVGSDSATVTITQNTPASGETKIVSVSTVALSTKTVTAVVAENSNTGQITVVSWAAN